MAKKDLCKQFPFHHSTVGMKKKLLRISIT